MAYLSYRLERLIITSSSKSSKSSGDFEGVVLASSSKSSKSSNDFEGYKVTIKWLFEMAICTDGKS